MVTKLTRRKPWSCRPVRVARIPRAASPRGAGTRTTSTLRARSPHRRIYRWTRDIPTPTHNTSSSCHELGFLGRQGTCNVVLCSRRRKISKINYNNDGDWLNLRPRIWWQLTVIINKVTRYKALSGKAKVKILALSPRPTPNITASSRVLAWSKSYRTSFLLF